MAIYFGSTKATIGLNETLSNVVRTQSRSVTPSTSSQTLVPDPGYNGMSQVVVNAIPNSYIIPEGTLSIYSDGIHSGVSAYSQVEVDTLSKFRAYIRDGMISNWYKSTTITDENITGIGIGRMAQIVNYSIVSLNLPNCSRISAYGLYNNQSLITVSLPNLTTLTGEKNFANCFSLTSINLPKLSLGYTTQAASAFYSCTNLTDVNFGSSVTAICDNMFFYCRKLTNFIASNVSAIGSSAFAYCSSLTNISFPELSIINNQSIFYSCGIESFTDINFPKLSTINHTAYNFLAYCSNLSIISFSKTISMNGGVAISPQSFIFTYFSTSLRTIYFENVYTMNSPQMFNFGTGRFSIDLIDIGFSNCYTLSKSLFSMGNWSLTSFNYINTIRLRNVTLEPSFFREAKYIQHIDLPNALRIHSDTCENAHNLLTISIPSVSQIYSYAFNNCYLLNSVYAPICNTVYDYAFQNCSSLTNIDLPLLSSIGVSAFAGCINLSSINMPIINRISSYAFSGTLISSLSLNNCYSITPSAFIGMTQLEKLYINYPSSGYLSGTIFGASSDNLSYTYPLSIISGTCYYLSSFRGSWFNTYLPNLKTINLNCYSVGMSTFQSNTILENLYLNGISNYSNISSTFGLYIDYGAFQRCTNLNTVSLTNVRYIREYAFENIKASNIYINTADTFASLPTAVFYSCSNLNTITISGNMSSNVIFYAGLFGNIPQLYSLTLNIPSVIKLNTTFSQVFYSNPYYSTTTYWSGPDPKIYVPASLVDAYKSASYWSNYSSYITAIV